MIRQVEGGRWANDKIVLAADTPTLWISRDANVHGVAGEVCDIWIGKPPSKLVDGLAVSWLRHSMLVHDETYIGAYTLAAVRSYFGVVPETAHELIRRG